MRSFYYFTYFETTIPLPPRADHKKPALATVKMARPLASLMTETGMIVSNPFSISSLPTQFYQYFDLQEFFLFLKNLLMNCSRILEALALSSFKLPRMGLLKLGPLLAIQKMLVTFLYIKHGFTYKHCWPYHLQSVLRFDQAYWHLKITV